MNDEEKQEKLIKRAIEIFGTTDQCQRAGYILPDGEMLDFGDPNRHYRDNEYRFFDHSEVWQVYEHFPEIEHIKKHGQCFAINFNDQWLKETGSIRFNSSAGYQITGEMFQPHTPTRKQMETLEYCNCMLQPTEEIILEFAKCDKEGKYIPKTFIERVRNDCVEPINDLNAKIKKWKNERES